MPPADVENQSCAEEGEGSAGAAAASLSVPDDDGLGPAEGHCDGFRGDDLYGWAWHPRHPDQSVQVELLIDGEPFGAATAREFRGDLRSAGIGDGRYGWRLAFPWELSRERRRLDVLVRTSGGGQLVDGAFVHHHEPPAEDQTDPELHAFVAQILGWPGAAPSVRAAQSETPARPLHLLLHSAAGGDGASLGASEYSYGFVSRAYRPVLERFGTVHDVRGDPARADALYREFTERGDGCLLFSFFPPQHTPLDLRAPIVPMIAWEYPTIPDGRWSDEPADDWRHVLRQAGRVVVASRQSAAAVHAAMGGSFPVAVIPHPVFDRMADAGPPRRPADSFFVEIDGFVFDTHSQAATARDRAADAIATGAVAVRLDGVVFTSIFSPRDGRKAWVETLTAFIDAHRDNARATLVLKMIARDPAEWGWELHDTLAREQAFACRVVALHGYLDDGAYVGLLAGSHWATSATLAEGQCLPLLEFMSVGRPAITPDHSAMADYINAVNALVVGHSEEACAWPNDTSNRLTASRGRLNWQSLRDSFRQGYDMVSGDFPRYARMGEEARRTMQSYCSDAVIAERLDSFLGLCAGFARRPPVPSALLAGRDETA